MEISVESGQQPFTVFVEGNTGAGKSTFLDFIETVGDFLVLKEPIEKWTNLSGHNLLDLKYKKPELFQFPFQSYATVTRLRQHLEATDKPMKFMERSLLSAKHSFVEELHDSGALHDGMYQVLQEFYKFINDYHRLRCDAIVYLRTSPQVAMERVQMRARSEESSVTMNEDYMTRIHNRLEALLVGPHKIISTPVIVIDANKNQNDIKAEYSKCFDEIQKLFNAPKGDSFIQI